MPIICSLCISSANAIWWMHNKGKSLKYCGAVLSCANATSPNHTNNCVANNSPQHHLKHTSPNRHYNKVLHTLLSKSSISVKITPTNDQKLQLAMKSNKAAAPMLDSKMFLENLQDPIDKSTQSKMMQQLEDAKV